MHFPSAYRIVIVVPSTLVQYRCRITCPFEHVDFWVHLRCSLYLFVSLLSLHVVP